MLSSKARYGLYAMQSLALRANEQALVPVDDIAAEHGIPLKFLEAILTQLRKRGLLSSRRGPNGGYALARAPERISLAEIIRTLDGPFAPTPCSRTKDPQQCEGCVELERCPIRPYMRQVRDAMAEILEQRTLAELAEEGELVAAEPLMFHI